MTPQSDNDPHWERGWRAHGYWQNQERLGMVGRPPGRKVGPQGYTWHYITPDNHTIEGREATLRKAKRAIEQQHNLHTKPPTKLYGRKTRVCHEHRTTAGAALVRIGQCENCPSKTNTGCGPKPTLCDQCSLQLNQCRYCRRPGK